MLCRCICDNNVSILHDRQQLSPAARNWHAYSTRNQRLQHLRFSGVWCRLLARYLVERRVLQRVCVELSERKYDVLIGGKKNLFMFILLAAVVATCGVFVILRLSGSESSELAKPLLQRSPGLVTFSSPDMVKLRSGMPPLIERPSLPQQGQQSGWPENEPIGVYLLHLGVSTPIDDGAAGWMLRLAKEHPNVDYRRAVIPHFANCFSRGRAGELMAAGVTESMKDEIVTFLIECCNSQVAEVRIAALSAITNGRLHLEYKALYDAAEDAYKNTTNVPPDRRRYIEYLWKGIQTEQSMNRPK